MLAWILRKKNKFTEVNIMFRMGMLYLYQIIGGSDFLKYEGEDKMTELSLKILCKSISSFINKRNFYENAFCDLFQYQ